MQHALLLHTEHMAVVIQANLPRPVRCISLLVSQMPCYKFQL